MKLDSLGYDELLETAKALHQQCLYYETRMLNKSEVAERSGMTVSWLDNSQCNKAQKLRSIGVRYGRTRTSPIRFPLAAVIEICLDVDCKD